MPNNDLDPPAKYYQSSGYRVVIGKSSYYSEGYLAGTAQGRAAGSRMYADDVKAFGGRPGVTVDDLPSMPRSEASDVVNGPGTIIGGFCESRACLEPYK